MDYNISIKDNLFVRLLQDLRRRNPDSAPFWAPRATAGASFRTATFIPSVGAAMTYIHTFKPNLVNEATFGPESPSAPAERAYRCDGLRQQPATTEGERIHTYASYDLPGFGELFEPASPNINFRASIRVQRAAFPAPTGIPT